MSSRRDFMKYATMTGGAVAAGSVSRNLMAALPEPVMQTEVSTMPPLFPDSGPDYNPVITPNGWTLPFRMRNNVKEFHLIAEPVVREMTPGFNANFVGLQRPEPGPYD